jgi:hypothetical protein
MRHLCLCFINKQTCAAGYVSLSEKSLCKSHIPWLIVILAMGFLTRVPHFVSFFSSSSETAITYFPTLAAAGGKNKNTQHQACHCGNSYFLHSHAARNILACSGNTGGNILLQ